MSPELDPEEYIDQEIDEVFNEFPGETIEERMGTAALQLVKFISEQRIASIEELEDRSERDKDARKAPKTSRPPFGEAILNGFMTFGMGFAGGYIPVPEDGSQEEVVILEEHDELSGKPSHLEVANIRLQEAKQAYGTLYGLKPREMNKAEARARNLEMAEQHPEG